jgi:hypothetical protein
MGLVRPGRYGHWRRLELRRNLGVHVGRSKTPARGACQAQVITLFVGPTSSKVCALQ